MKTTLVHLAIRAAALLAALCVVSACDDFDFEQAEEITKLRTLAIRMEPPELFPGAVSTIDALAVTPNDRPIAYQWELCAFDDGPDGGYACATDDEGNVLGLVISTEATAEVSYDMISAAVGTAEELCSLLSEAEVPDFVELPECVRGFPLTLRLTTTVGDGEGDDTEIAVKRVLLLNEDAVPNQNPSIDGVLVAGQPIATDTLVIPFDDEPVPLQVLVDPAEQAETYEAEDEDGEVTQELEELAISWFTTHGNYERSTSYFYEDEVTGAELQTNELTLDKGAEPAEPGDEIRLWFVLRDDRGGTDFVERRVVVGDAP